MTPPALPPVSGREPRPMVSVVMPTFNRADLLGDSARMVLAQTWRDLELIVADDHSTDETPAIVAALARDDARVRYVRPPVKGGVTAVVNAGIQQSRGEFVQICHDHDIYLPRLTERLADVLQRHPLVVYVHPGRQGCDHDGRPLAHRYFVCNYPEVTAGPDWRRFMLGRLDSPVTALSMIRRSALERSGLFDPDFGAVSDVEMWLRLCAYGDVGYVNERLLYVRGRDARHPYSGAAWELTAQVIRAHRQHLPAAYAGGHLAIMRLRKEIAIDVALARDFLNSARHRRWAEVEAGRAYLRQHGGWLSRGVALGASWLVAEPTR
ncbi:MAG TPA: glycosyltransferase family A protein [Methylomirabilota bacterium]|jgi:glycosyltransferase involved in cell wall biosynthesis